MLTNNANRRVFHLGGLAFQSAEIISLVGDMKLSNLPSDQDQHNHSAPPDTIPSSA
jgi:hypothetical protein